LITQQSKDEFLSNLDKNKIVVVSISPQSRASLAAYFNLSPLQTLKKLTTFFKKILNCNFVLDTSFSREFSLLESCYEFIARYNKTSPDVGPLPMLASACPGWVCYAEKAQGSFILPYISTAKSPQQVMGTLVKNYFASKQNLRFEVFSHRLKSRILFLNSVQN
jgi:iron only hydrogenase large subunit-like protein